MPAETRMAPDQPAEGHSTNNHDDDRTVPVSIPPRVDDEGEAWEDPRPLTETAPRATFPTDALPNKAAEFVRSAASSIGVDEGVIGSVVLSVLSAATVGRVRVKAWGSLVERTVLWVLIVAEPGERKTSVFAAARAPLEEVQEDLRTEAGGVGRRIALGRLSAANAALKNAERDLSEAYAAADDPLKATDEKETAEALETAITKLDTAAERASELAVPELPRLIASDVTPEALHDLMAEQGSRLALFIPEGQSLLHRLANAGNGSDMEPYLAGHGGDTMYRDRVSRSVDPVEDPSLVMSVMTQPEVLSSKATDEMKWSGFMDRFLLVRPRSLAGTRFGPGEPHRHVRGEGLQPDGDADGPDVLAPRRTPPRVPDPRGTGRRGGLPRRDRTDATRRDGPGELGRMGQEDGGRDAADRGNAGSSRGPRGHRDLGRSGRGRGPPHPVL